MKRPSENHKATFGAMLLLTAAFLVVQESVAALETRARRGVKVEKRHEIDSCGVSGSQLPMEGLLPASYHLMLDLDMQEAARKFAGKLEILLQIRQPTSKILLNAHETLEIDEIWYEDYGQVALNGRDGPQQVGVKRACLNVQQQILVLDLERQLEADSVGLLNFIYLAQYSTQSSAGLWKSSYTNRSSGKTERFLASELEPRPEVPMARKVFPCFDEPQLKAFIELEVAREANFEVRSNSEPSSDSEIPDGSGRKLIKFKRTEAMAPQKLHLTLREITKQA